jgi:hypothetical protein
MCLCFDFLHNFFSEIFVILGRNEEEKQIKYVFMQSTCYSYKIFNKTWNVSSIFRKVLKEEISWKSAWWEPSSLRLNGRKDEQTDTHNEAFFSERA